MEKSFELFFYGIFVAVVVLFFMLSLAKFVPSLSILDHEVPLTCTFIAAWIAAPSIKWIRERK